MSNTLNNFVRVFNDTAAEVHDIAVSKGWWETERNDGEIVCLMHSELTEAYKAWRKKDAPSEKIPEFSHVEEEYADLLIRILDMILSRGWQIAEVIAKKLDGRSDPMNPANFVQAFNWIQGLAWGYLSDEDDWWMREHEVDSCIAELHSYLDDALEAMRLPDSNRVAIESAMAKVVMGLMGVAYQYDYCIGAATVAKIKCNRSRSHKHGGKKF